MRNKKIIFCLLVFFLLSVIIALCVFCWWYLKRGEKETSVDTATSEQGDEEDISAYSGVTQRFAEYKEAELEFSPQVEPYTVDSELSNVTNADDFEFSEDASEMLEGNAFVVISGSEYDKEFFQIYEQNRYDSIPSFISSDSVLHNYHLLYDHILKTVEEEQLYPVLESILEEMQSECEEIYSSTSDDNIKLAAKRNVAFFSVALRLLDDTASVPSYVSDVVDEELQLIDDHTETFYMSPIMTMGIDGKDITVDYKEDYSQYIPRGHYTKSEILKKYFKSMMWLGRITFRQKMSSENMSSLLITYIINANDDIRNQWDQIYEPTNFFVGKADDLTCYDYNDIMVEVFGESPNLSSFDDESKFSQFEEKIKDLPSPAINSMPIWDESVNPDREEEIKGFRFMGQRYTLDASVFQNLVYRSVGADESGQKRMLPKSLDFVAAMGSEESYNLLEEAGDTGFERYPENMEKSKEYIASLGKSIWTQNLYWGWLYSLKPLSEEVGEGYPIFMTNQAWVRKDMNSYLGSWTELKHDTILYAKQVYIEMGDTPGGEKDFRGYVEPRPYVYSRLTTLTNMTKEGLSERDLIDEGMVETLSEMAELTDDLTTIAVKELENEDLTDEEYELIEYYGGKLEHFWQQTLESGGNPLTQIDDNPAALIADVATDTSGVVLEEGIGRINSIYVVVPVDGSLRLAKGAVFSYYEFAWDQTDRLTDEKWREIVFAESHEDMPDSPSWTDMFLVQE